MKVSIDWLKELVDLKITVDELVELLPLRSIGTKEVTERFIELDMKGYNRADLLSMRGVALETAAITGSKVLFDDESSEIGDQGEFKVSIESSDDCPIYCVAVIDNLKIGKSDQLVLNKLADSGVREVNNLADITNLVMLEYGQPLHAFDGDSVSGGIDVRRAKSGEEIETLDGKKRVLQSTDIVIASGDTVLGVAGVMGGKNCEIGAETTSVVLEAAIFDPKKLRQTANRLNIHSEAAKRFYHGLTRKRLLQAFVEAIEQYKAIGGVVKSIRIVGDYTDKEVEIEVGLDKVRELIGVDLEDNFIEEALKKLYFDVQKENDVIRVKPPYFRLDCRLGVDLIEEVARMYGYEKIPAKTLKGQLPDGGDQARFEYEARIRESMVKLGFNEVLTYSFVGSLLMQVLAISKEGLVKVANPISSETEYMREGIWPNLVEKTIENLKYRKVVRMFEIGKVYSAVEGLVVEDKVLSIALADGSENPLEMLSGVVVKLSELMKKNWSIREKSGNEGLHPIRQIEICEDQKVLGVGGEVNREVIDKLGGSIRVAVIEIRI